MPFDRRTFLKGLITFPFGVDILKQFTDTIIENEKIHPENAPKIKWGMEIYSGSIPSWAEALKFRFQVMMHGVEVSPDKYEPTGDLLARIDSFKLRYNPNFKTYFNEDTISIKVIKTGTMGYFLIYRNGEKCLAGTIGTAGADMNVSSLGVHAEEGHEFRLDNCTIQGA